MWKLKIFTYGLGWLHVGKGFEWVQRPQLPTQQPTSRRFDLCNQAHHEPRREEEKKTFTKLGLLRIKNLNQKLGIYWRLRFKIMWLKNVFKTTGNVTLRLENLVIYIIILFVSDFIYQGTTTFSKSLWNNLWMPHQNLHGVTRSSIYGMMKGSGAGFRFDWRICSVV